LQEHFKVVLAVKSNGHPATAVWHIVVLADLEPKGGREPFQCSILVGDDEPDHIDVCERRHKTIRVHRDRVCVPIYVYIQYDRCKINRSWLAPPGHGYHERDSETGEYQDSGVCFASPECVPCVGQTGLEHLQAESFVDVGPYRQISDSQSSRQRTGAEKRNQVVSPHQISTATGYNRKPTCWAKMELPNR
jgi:hypothetical protein